MLHGVAKTVLTVALMMIGCTAGYFGTATYYEQHPQTVAQSHECDTIPNSIGYKNRNDFLATNRKENWRTWRQREIELSKETTAPTSTIFNGLHTTLKGQSETSLNGEKIRDKCREAYQKNNNTDSNSEENKTETDAKKYCKFK
ncbi:hypothetical protein [Candidatus Mycoplasma haematohominis]|uniref:hypothetical protein n=1 Tax=Candidatus Mycoplasma haematohominis TaxID=1494318 RepID=UPI001C0A7299|nr:hypothetical protein [Candidatus Mycoplasma haemohominis]